MIDSPHRDRPEDDAWGPGNSGPVKSPLAPAERRALRSQLAADLHWEDVLAGQRMRFVTTWGLFSPRRVDSGSRLLLDLVETRPEDHCLDLGCGYGVLGLTLARQVPQGHCLLVDKDFVAVEFARRNAVLNGLERVECQLSNGLQQIRERRFDLVVSNLPAKVGKELLTLWLLDIHEQLNPNGSLVVVTITGLRRFIERGFRDVFGNYEKVKQGKEYTVARAFR